MRMLGAVCLAAFLAGCAKSSVIPMSQDTAMITTSAAPMCGPTGAQQVALQQAAIHTIKSGYDRFVITGGQYQNTVQVVGHTPVVAQTTGSATGYAHGGMATAHGQSTTVVSGGQPIMGGSHNQGLMVKLFKEGDPAGANAVVAKSVLGPDWKKTVESGVSTCTG